MKKPTNNGNTKIIFDNPYAIEKKEFIILVLPNGLSMNNDLAENDIFPRIK